MTRRWSLLLVVGWATALVAAEPDVVWPSEWTVFGPISSKTAGTAKYGLPEKKDLLPGEMLKSVPRELAIDGKQYQGRKLSAEKGVLDLGRKFNWAGDGIGAYLLAPVEVAAETTVQIGAGADWWMQWWVDGEPVYDTLGNGHEGNGSLPVTGRDHVFSVKLAKGRHVMAVALFGYRQFLLAVTSPQELRERPAGFQDVLTAGQRKLRPPQWSISVNYASARRDFERALRLAANDVQQAEARLAIADNYFADAQNLETSHATKIRQEYTAVLALPEARAEQKTQAALGVAETWLLENRCDLARAELGKVGSPMAQFVLARVLAQEKNNVAAQTNLTQLSATDGLLKFNARSFMEALEMAPRIRPDHPRLFFNADTWPAVKARVERDRQNFSRLQRATQSLPEQPVVKDWGEQLMPAALVYRATGDAALLAKIRKLLRATIDHYLLLKDFNAHVTSRVECAAALDWVWNDLPTAEREALTHDFLRYAYGRHVQDLGRGIGLVDHDPYYYLANMHWYVGLAVWHPNLSGPDYLRALTLLGRGYDNNVIASFGERIERMKDRGCMTKLEYAFVDLPTPAWTFMHCWQSAIGPVPEEWAFASGIAPSYALRNVLGAAPGHFRDFAFSKSWRKRGGWTPGTFLADHMAQFVYFFGKTQPEEAAIAGYVRHVLERGGCVGKGTYMIYPYVMDSGATTAPKLPEGLPLAQLYAGYCGQVLMSSGFESNSTYALFCSGGVNGQAVSEHYDAGHFTIFKQGFLALDSGTRALEQPDPAPGENYDRQSVAHNTVLIRMPGETMRGLTAAIRLEANSGGQCRLPQFSRVLAFETDRLFAYAATDATATYHTNKCAQMVRQFLFLTPDHFVVFDRVVSKNADYPKTWLLHTANEPVITGRELRADQDRGRIFCRTLYPTDAVLEKIGGPGKEFWADGRNWPVPASSPYLKQVGMANSSEVPENMGRWRVEVKPGAPRTEDCFLHLIQVAEQTVANMVPSKVVENNGHVVIAFTAGSCTYTIQLNKAGVIGGHIRIEEAGGAVVDKELARACPALQAQLPCPADELRAQTN